MVNVAWRGTKLPGAAELRRWLRNRKRNLRPAGTDGSSNSTPQSPIPRSNCHWGNSAFFARITPHSRTEAGRGQQWQQFLRREGTHARAARCRFAIWLFGVGRPAAGRRSGHGPERGLERSAAESGSGVQYPPPQRMQPGRRQPVAGQSAMPTRWQPAAAGRRRSFVLTPQEQADVDRVLDAWERRGKEVRTFQCTFHPLGVRRHVSGKAQQGQPQRSEIHRPRHDQVRRARQRVLRTPKDIPWTIPKSDGRSNGFATASRSSSTIGQEGHCTEYPLPTELQGKAIVDGPLPFLFGARRRSSSSDTTSNDHSPRHAREIWLDAYPRFLADAPQFPTRPLVLKTKGMIPVGVADLFARRQRSPSL